MVAITHLGPVRSHSLVVGHRPSPATYRRRRLAVLGVVALALALVLALVELGRATLDPSVPARPVARVSVVVTPGDTVWSLAAELAPGDDPRPVVDAIVEANGGAELVAGQRLELVVP